MMNSTLVDWRVLLDAVIATLQQGEALLSQLDNETYARKMPLAFNASIGAHYRHGLDHFGSVLEATKTGTLNYDLRERDPLIENDRFAALNATRELLDGFQQLAEGSGDQELQVTCQTSYISRESQMARSTVRREMMYVVAHAAHHYALISILCGLQGVAITPGFGVAPSTLKHQAALARAASA